MDRFKPQPLFNLLPDGFNLRTFKDDNGEAVSLSFTARHEFEIDAAITGLLIFRQFLRDNIEPLPKGRSLEIINTPIEEPDDDT